jgi:hypothetical protein
MPGVRLDAVDAAELLQFLSQWLARDPGRLSVCREECVGHPAYNVSQLRQDLDRFTFLLGGDDGEALLHRPHNMNQASYDLSRLGRNGLIQKIPGQAVHDARAHDEVDRGGRGDVIEGLPGMATISAHAPGLSTPRSLRPSSSAATDVAARSARSGESPAATIAWNSRMPWLNANMPQSVPKATFTSLAAIARSASRIRSLSRRNFQTACSASVPARSASRSSWVICMAGTMYTARRGCRRLVQFLFTPLVAGWSIWVGIAISARSAGVRAAQQVGFFATLPRSASSR